MYLACVYKSFFSFSGEKPTVGKCQPRIVVQTVSDSPQLNSAQTPQLSRWLYCMYIHSPASTTWPDHVYLNFDCYTYDTWANITFKYYNNVWSKSHLKVHKTVKAPTKLLCWHTITVVLWYIASGQHEQTTVQLQWTKPLLVEVSNSAVVPEAKWRFQTPWWYSAGPRGAPNGLS